MKMENNQRASAALTVKSGAFASKIRFEFVHSLLSTSNVWGEMLLPDFLFLFSFRCSADHKRNWPPCKVE